MVYNNKHKKNNMTTSRWDDINDFLEPSYNYELDAEDVSLLNRDEISSSIKKKGARRLDDIWEYVNKGESLGGGHYKASCKWCGGGWTRGRPQDMKVHLARICIMNQDDLENN